MANKIRFSGTISYDNMNSGDRTNDTRKSTRGRHMILAKDLQLNPPDVRRGSGRQEYVHKFWRRVNRPDWLSSTELVAELVEDTENKPMEITGKVEWKDLLKETNYAAYLIFKTMENATGLDNFLEASIKSSSIKLERKMIVCINQTNVRSHDRSIGLPELREPGDANGWMEVKLGIFYRDIGQSEEEVINLKDSSKDKKKGLIVAGIELRPI